MQQKTNEHQCQQCKKKTKNERTSDIYVKKTMTSAVLRVRACVFKSIVSLSISRNVFTPIWIRLGCRKILKRLQKAGCTAILRFNDEHVARDAMNAAVDGLLTRSYFYCIVLAHNVRQNTGGFTALEFTLSVPNAAKLIREFSRNPGLL